MELGPGEEPGQDSPRDEPGVFLLAVDLVGQNARRVRSGRVGFPECSSDGSMKVHSPWFGVAGAAVWCDAGGRRTY